MVILRATARVLRYLPPPTKPDHASDTALGDWYVNRITVDRQPLLLMVSSTSLLPILVRAQAVATLPKRLPDVVGARLVRLGIDAEAIEAEVAAMSPVLVARTADRSILGILVDFTKAVRYYPPPWDDDKLRLVEAQLAETPCFAGRPGNGVVFPDVKAPALLLSAGERG